MVVAVTPDEAGAEAGVGTSAPKQRRRARMPGGERSLWLIPSVLALACLVLLIVAPLGYMFVDAVSEPEGGGFTFGNFVEAFSRPEYLEPIWHSVKLGLTVAVLCVLIGVPLAWLVARTDLPGGRILRSAAYISFVLPSLLTAVAWVILASPNAGLINRLTFELFGARPLNVFSMNFLAVIIAFSMFSYTFQFTLASLDNLGGEIEEAAAISGAGPVRRTLTVVLPLALPAIMSSVIVVFLQTVALYGAPALIAVPAGEQVITTQLFSFFAYPQRPELAAAYGVPLIIFAAVLIWLRKRILGRRGYATVGGKAGGTYLVRLGKWRWPIAVLVWAVFTIAVLLPAFTLLYIALLRNWALLGFDFTLDNFAWALEFGADAVRNSVIFAFWTGTLCSVLGLIVAYLGERRSNWLNRALVFLSTAPLVVPGMILAIGMLAAYSKPPLALYGTAVILIVAFWARFLPIALQNLQSAVAQINPELELASRIGGAGLGKTVFRITLPLVRGSFVSAWIFTFVLSTHEISAAMLLVNTDTQVMPTLVTNLYEQALYGRIAALGIIMVVITMVAVIAGRFLARSPWMSRKAN